MISALQAWSTGDVGTHYSLKNGSVLEYTHRISVLGKVRELQGWVIRDVYTRAGSSACVFKFQFEIDRIFMLYLSG